MAKLCFVVLYIVETSCNPENLKYGNREYVYDGKMFDTDKILIVSKLEGFLV